MSWPFFTQVVGELVDAGVEELGLFYLGEPFECDWIAEAVAFAKGRGIGHVFLATRGALATPHRVRACLDSGLNSLRFSVDEPDAADWDEAFENLKEARRLRDAGSYSCAISATSLRREMPPCSRTQTLTNEILRYVDEYHWLAPRAGREPLPCWSLFTEVCITFDGRLCACRFDAGERHVMANLNEMSFLEGWGCARLRKLREAHLKRDVRGTVCEDCARCRKSAGTIHHFV